MSDDSGAESEEEFVLPPGFEAVSGSSLTKESLNDKELWLFRLPKHMDAKALHGVSFKIPKDQGATIEVPVEANDEKHQYTLKSNDSHLYSQVVNLVPEKAKGNKYVPGKPFTRSFSLVEKIQVPQKTIDESPAKKRSSTAEAEPATEPTKKKKKSKKHQS